MARAWLIAVVAILCSSVSLCAQTGRLGQLRREMIAKPVVPEPKGPTSHDSSYNTGANGEALGQLLWGAAMALGATPGFLLDDDHKTEAYFPVYPHVNEEPGYMTAAAELGDTWALRLNLDAGNNFDDLQRYGAQLWFDTTARWGGSARVVYYQEAVTPAFNDDLFLTTVNVHYRVAQHPLMNWYLGAGLNLLPDNAKTKAGFNLTYGFDIFPIKPLIISASADFGSLGPEILVHTHATLGANFRHFEIFGGYDWLHVGKANINTPIVGLRIWY